MTLIFQITTPKHIFFLLFVRLMFTAVTYCYIITTICVKAEKTSKQKAENLSSEIEVSSQPFAKDVNMKKFLRYYLNYFSKNLS